ncbi:hypothetical protein CLV29_1682 [Naumannella halotolerans]|uniref:Uncharacterized protein n=1 Tax=Naumannella halotolerans TaxID=993414 RepID=A0A4R7JBJ2_9ACTN|nr:hypothetical protein CLV29_1682 [Naumannella halotolerans]
MACAIGIMGLSGGCGTTEAGPVDLPSPSSAVPDSPATTEAPQSTQDPAPEPSPSSDAGDQPESDADGPADADDPADAGTGDSGTGDSGNDDQGDDGSADSDTGSAESGPEAEERDGAKPDRDEVRAGLQELANLAAGDSEGRLEPYYDCVVDELYDELDADRLREIADSELPGDAIGPLRSAVLACVDEHGSA